MNRIALSVRVAVSVGLVVLMATPQAARGNLVDEEGEIYVVRPLITEAAWVQTGAYLKSFLFDMPEAISRPNAQVGFVFTPGFTWSILDILELNLGFPLVLNPDETGDRELDHPPPELPDNWDSHPDFDLPGLQVGLKGWLLGRKPEDRVFVAVGILANLPIVEEWASNFVQWKSAPYQNSPFLVSPYLTVTYAMDRFSPTLQMGVNLRSFQSVDSEGEFNLDDDNNPMVFWHKDLFVNLALPFAFPFEGTAPMLEVNGAFNLDEETWQVFITPAVTFLPEKSAASLGFACMIPILDSSFRKKEGFRFVVNFSYRIDALAIPGAREEKGGGGTIDESPPAGW